VFKSIRELSYAHDDFRGPLVSDMAARQRAPFARTDGGSAHEHVGCPSRPTAARLPGCPDAADTYLVGHAGLAEFVRVGRRPAAWDAASTRLISADERPDNRGGTRQRP